MKRCVLCVLTLVAVLGLTLAPVLAANNGNPNPRVIPPTAQVADQNGIPLSYADWGDRYTRWSAAIPLSFDVLATPSLGQDPASPVFFLPSATGLAAGPLPYVLEGPITVPADKLLFFPITWIYNAWTPFFDCCWTSAEQYRACAPSLLASLLVPASTLYATLDGQPLAELARYRACSAQPFEITFAADKFGGLPCEVWGSFTSSQALSDGYWLMLTPLSPGQHTITFGSSVLHTTLYVTVPSDD